MKKNYFIGTSGYSYEHWREIFYPRELGPTHWLTFYAQRFDTVEINSSFYRLPSTSAFKSWYQAVGEKFIFALKVSRYLTHMKKLKNAEEILKNFMQRASLLKEKLGPLLYQFPPRWRCDLKRFKEFVSILSPHYQHVIEFRDPDWFREEVRKIMQERNIAFCIHDFPAVTCPFWVTSQLVYFRRHGYQVKYQGKYPKEELKKLAEDINKCLSQGKKVFVYFNNDQQGFAVENTKELESMLSKDLTILVRKRS